MGLDYVALGRRVRENRIRMGFSQERLAELANLSVTHISNIEHAKTKVALPSLVVIANALEATVDELLGDSLTRAYHFYLNSIGKELSDCTPLELRCMEELIRQNKRMLRNYRKSLTKGNGET